MIGWFILQIEITYREISNTSVELISARHVELPLCSCLFSERSAAKYILTSTVNSYLRRPFLVCVRAREV